MIISTILLPVCALTFQAIAPPPISLPHKMYRLKNYVLSYDDDKNSSTKSNEVYELCDPTINLSILLQTTQNNCLCYIHNSLMKFVNVYVQDRVHITQNTLFLTICAYNTEHTISHNLSSAKREYRQVDTVKYCKMRLIISIINIYPR